MLGPPEAAPQLVYFRLVLGFLLPLPLLTLRTDVIHQPKAPADEAESRKDNAPVRGATTAAVVVLTGNTGLCIR
jgi:hypothetical protein